MTIDFVSNVVSFKRFFPGVIIQAVKIKNEGNIRFNVGYHINFIIGRRFRSRRRSIHDEKREGRNFDVNREKSRCSRIEEDDDHRKGSARFRDDSSLIPCYKT